LRRWVRSERPPEARSGARWLATFSTECWGCISRTLPEVLAATTCSMWSNQASSLVLERSSAWCRLSMGQAAFLSTRRGCGFFLGTYSVSEVLDSEVNLYYLHARRVPATPRPTHRNLSCRFTIGSIYPRHDSQGYVGPHVAASSHGAAASLRRILPVGVSDYQSGMQHLDYWIGNLTSCTQQTRGVDLRPALPPAPSEQTPREKLGTWGMGAVCNRKITSHPERSARRQRQPATREVCLSTAA
jgi:hypothetical protein